MTAPTASAFEIEKDRLRGEIFSLAHGLVKITDPTPPAVSDALREAVAREIDPHAFTYGEADYYGSSLDKACDSARIRVALKKADAILSGPIASEIARLTGEREVAEMLLERRKVDLRAAEAETARLRDALEEIIRLHNAPTPDADAIVWMVRRARAALSSQEQADV